MVPKVIFVLYSSEGKKADSHFYGALRIDPGKKLVALKDLGLTFEQPFLTIDEIIVMYAVA